MSWDGDYPRPQLRRNHWINLDGDWQFAIDRHATWTSPGDVPWQATIAVPFAPETPASGINDTDYFLACWYRTTFDLERRPGQRLVLHFGAVDDVATVWVNGQCMVTHEGGYTPFSADITPVLTERGPREIVVRAFDDPHDMAKPRGKQDWLPQPHSIWYPRTTGIWQTVWLEWVPLVSIEQLIWTADVERWAIGLDASIGGSTDAEHVLTVKLTANGQTLADDAYSVTGGVARRTIQLPDPGIDDARNPLLWTPTTPTLIDAVVTLTDRTGAVIDRIESYTALRSIGIQGDRIVLNGRPVTLRLALDQGYWPETGLTAPDSAALKRDVELARAMGFNGVRKHQKIEDPRFLAWADCLGLFVWEELPSAYRFDRRSINRLTRTWTEAIERDLSHPCIIAWVPFNESWGVPDLPGVPAQRRFVEGLYNLTKALDPTRLVIGNDGWENVRSDILCIHDYDDSPERIEGRYTPAERESGRLFAILPAGRALSLEDPHDTGQPIMLSEFGGIAFTASEDRDATWGYVRSDSPESFAAAYTRLLETVRAMPVFSGFCYTQLTDTYQEANGLLTMDRTPKFPIEEIALATHGPKSPRELEREHREAIKKMAKPVQ